MGLVQLVQSFTLPEASSEQVPPPPTMNALFTLFLFLLPTFILLARRWRSLPKGVPPGSLGLPLIGQSISLLQAMRANTAEQWLEERIKKYGPISKMSLFGQPAVFIHGQAANKLVFAGNSSTISNKQAKSNQMILGERSLLELSGEDHKRVRGAIVSFLKPESLRQYVGKMDAEVRNHLETHWQGKKNVKVLPLMKTLTFNVICSLIIGVERGIRREKILGSFEEMIRGIWSVPVNLPFTSYNRSLKASRKIQSMIKELMTEKEEELEKGASPHQDLITCLLSTHGENKEVVAEQELVENVMLVMAAGHDTTAVLLTFMVRLLANDPDVYAAVLREHEEVAKGKAPGELLTWEDLAMMKYTWRVALETLRLIPPVFAGFRTALKDIEFGGYLIPKGWKIFWATSMTHLDNNIFPEPTKFDPSRFENQASIPPYCFIPFGGGPRICVGIEFARIETLVTIHNLVTSFKWKLCHPDNSYGRIPTATPAGGLPIEITPMKL